MLSKTERMNALLDWYDKLLTEKQKASAAMYFREDYSLAEIAEHTQSSRSAVYDTLQRVEKILEDTEAKLRCIEKYDQRRIIYQKLRKIHSEAVDEYINQLIDLE